jgi:invasion protein IalB
MSKLSIRLLFITVVTTIAIQQAAYAAPKAGEKFGDWIYGCQTVAAKKKICSLTQSIISKRNKKPIISVMLSRRGEKKELRLIVVTPLGIYIPSGVTAVIDKEDKMPLRLRACNSQGCITNTKVTKSLKQKLADGKEMIISFSFGGGKKPLFAKISLKGITKGLKAIDD